LFIDGIHVVGDTLRESQGVGFVRLRFVRIHGIAGRLALGRFGHYECPISLPDGKGKPSVRAATAPLSLCSSKAYKGSALCSPSRTSSENSFGLGSKVTKLAIFIHGGERQLVRTSVKIFPP